MRPRAALFTLAPIALLLLPIAVFGVDRVTSEDRVPRNVSVGGVEIGGMSRGDAVLALRAQENRLRSSPATFRVLDSEFRLDPTEVGFTVDVEAAVDAAMARRGNGGIVDGFLRWVDSLRRHEELALPASIDPTALDRVLDRWEDDAIPDPADEGGVTVVDGTVVPRYPRSGRAVDRDAAGALVLTALSSPERAPVDLPVVTTEPRLTRADVDAAAERVRAVIDAPVTLRNTDLGVLVTFTPEQLAEALRVEVVDDPPRLELSLDPDAIAAALEPRRAELEREPVDAAYAVDPETDEVTVVAGRAGTRLDVDAVTEALLEAAEGPDLGPFPVAEGAPPGFTTAEAESYLPLYRLSEFTTYFNCCRPRVRNIKLMADTVDGTIVMPGETYSLNDAVGIRTVEKGYVEDCAIVSGDIVCEGHPANVGGGVSQFTTTLYNAIFFSCMEIVEFRPHSIWFDRYPMGREATLGFPKPDLVFRNDSDKPVVIETAYTDTSVTVRFYGDNGGLICEADTSEPTEIVEPELELVPDEDGELAPGEEEQVRDGRPGFLVHVTRVITYPDGTVEREPTFEWRYRPLTTQVKVHPCMVTGEPVDCPVTLPDVVGKTYAEALSALDAAGFVVVPLTEKVSDPAKVGIVVRMDPAGGWAQPGSSVKVWVGSP